MREWWDEVIWPLVSVAVAVIALAGLVGAGFMAGVAHESSRTAGQPAVDARGWPECRIVLEKPGCIDLAGKHYFREIKGEELRGSSRAPEAKR